MKRTPLKRRTALRASKRLKRSGYLRRNKPLRSTPRPLDPKLREQCRERANGCCERCGISDQAIRCDPHHVRRKSQGGADALANLRWVCALCHSHIHEAPREAANEGWLILLDRGNP